MFPRSAEYLEPRMARYMPSAAQLPRVWNEEMDRFICECEAVGDMDSITMIRALKQKFPELHGVVLSAESIERRILMLEQMDNDYFVAGMETAVARAEAAGFTLPPMDLEKYARQPDENEATESAAIVAETGTDSKAMETVGQDDEQTGEGSTQSPSGDVLSPSGDVLGPSGDVLGPSGDVLGSDKTNEKSVDAPAGDVLGSGKTHEKQKSVDAPAAGQIGRKLSLKSKMKARLGIGKENKSGASSSRGDNQELQSRPNDS